ncbi:rhomboid family intramembrane serine protease [Natronococcus wangiae]|uniref:rhomboid family intramembrane serine protease n=1 Tax=Natronococcus wangiae TaxID=3068275 RepID=UPI00273DF7DF|nr:rhomboid family intramembrane serine protease [Natronococcus sp. AD5]
MDPIAAAVAGLVVVALLGSAAIVRRLHRPDRPWAGIARARLVMGVPWGSLVVIVAVCVVYLFVQDGITDPSNPVAVPYRAWSYFYPLGMLTASFSHVGPTHLVGNVLGAAVAAPIAEYAWGHYPDDREAEAAESWRTDPWVRALVGFPLTVFAVGLVTSLFALGPVIGFSGLVFAFAGFAIVHYPIVTLVGVLGVQGALLTIFRALQRPINVYVAEPSPPGPPTWATIAIQGHALGFFIGVVLGIALLRRRGTRPDPLHLWIAVLLFGFAKSLWAIYWFGGDDTFVLFRGPGVVVVAVLAIVITLAATGSERPIVPRRFRKRIRASEARSSDGSSPGTRPLEMVDGRSGRADANPRLERIVEIARGARTSEPTPELSRRRAAFLIVLVVTAVLAGLAVPANLLLVEDDPSSETHVDIQGYTVEYAENVENELVSPVAVGPFDDAVSLESSGVIVRSDQRQIWLEAVTSRRLEFTGEETVHLGGPGWREAVHVERTGWEPVGNETVYQVWIEGGGEDRQLAHESGDSRADVRIDDRSVTVASDDGEFVLEVAEVGGDDAATAPIPGEGRSTDAGGLAFERDDGTIYAVSNGTEVAVATEETYD